MATVVFRSDGSRGLKLRLVECQSRPLCVPIAVRRPSNMEQHVSAARAGTEVAAALGAIPLLAVFSWHVGGAAVEVRPFDDAAVSLSTCRLSSHSTW